MATKKKSPAELKGMRDAFGVTHLESTLGDAGSDAFHDLAAELVDTKRKAAAREERLRKAAVDGQDACFLCGRPIAASGHRVEGELVGPKCYAALRKRVASSPERAVAPRGSAPDSEGDRRILLGVGWSRADVSALDDEELAASADGVLANFASPPNLSGAAARKSVLGAKLGRALTDRLVRYVARSGGDAGEVLRTALEDYLDEHALEDRDGSVRATLEARFYGLWDEPSDAMEFLDALDLDRDRSDPGYWVLALRSATES